MNYTYIPIMCTHVEMTKGMAMAMTMTMEMAMAIIGDGEDYGDGDDDLAFTFESGSELSRTIDLFNISIC